MDLMAYSGEAIGVASREESLQHAPTSGSLSRFCRIRYSRFVKSSEGVRPFGEDVVVDEISDLCWQAKQRRFESIALGAARQLLHGGNETGNRLRLTFLRELRDVWL